MANFEGDGKAILVGFIGAIIAIVLLASYATDIVGQTSTFSETSKTVTAPAVGGTLDLIGRELFSVATIINASNITGVDLATQGILITDEIGSAGLLTVQMTLNSSATAWDSQSVNVTYNYKPDGYLNNSGARSINLLVPIFSALAILVFILVMFIKTGSLGKLLRS